jgi:hypothetical protein
VAEVDHDDVAHAVVAPLRGLLEHIVDGAVQHYPFHHRKRDVRSLFAEPHVVLIACAPRGCRAGSTPPSPRRENATDTRTPCISDPTTAVEQLVEHRQRVLYPLDRLVVGQRGDLFDIVANHGVGEQLLDQIEILRSRPRGCTARPRHERCGSFEYLHCFGLVDGGHCTLDQPHTELA